MYKISSENGNRDLKTLQNQAFFVKHITKLRKRNTRLRVIQETRFNAGLRL